MKSIRVRLLASFGVTLAVALTGFGVLAHLLVARDLNADLDDLLKTKTFIAKQQVDFRKPQAIAMLEQATDFDRGGFFIQFFEPDGKLVGKSARLTVAIPLVESTRRTATDRSDAVLETVTDSRGRTTRLATAARHEQFDRSRSVLGFVQVGVTLAERDRRLHTLLTWLLVGGPGVLLISLGIAWFMLDRWLGALTAVEDTARRISAQNLSRQRVFVSPGDAELARLAQSFNELLDRLESSYATQQRFVADASHELRTPLTVLRGEIEVALRKPRGADDYRDVLQSNREEIERLSRLVENLLSLASADAGEGLAVKEPVELGALVHEVAHKLVPAAAAKQIGISVEAADAVEVNGDRFALERIVFNLVENAIRYSPEGESVNLRVSAAGAEAVLEVADTGSGIAPEHLPHIFERFYRVDKARSRDMGGAGLGLSIVRVLVDAHGGRVEVQSQLGHGTKFTVRLPGAENKPE